MWYSYLRLIVLIFLRCDHPCPLSPAIIVPDYSADNVGSLIELLKNGSTTVVGQSERVNVTQLQRILSCGFSMSSPVYNTSHGWRFKEHWTLRNKVLCVDL